MRPFISFLLTAIVFISCSSSGKENKNESSGNDSASITKKEDEISMLPGYFRAVGDSFEMPSFEIDVELSDKAEKEIKNKKETVIVAAYFSGIPKDTTLYMEDGEYALGSHNIELTNSRSAKFEGMKISKTAFESLADKDIQVLINIFTGRRSSTVNLLNCDILQKPVSELKDQKFLLKGKLIKE